MISEEKERERERESVCVCVCVCEELLRCTPGWDTLYLENLTSSLCLHETGTGLTKNIQSSSFLLRSRIILAFDISESCTFRLFSATQLGAICHLLGQRLKRRDVCSLPTALYHHARSWKLLSLYIFRTPTFFIRHSTYPIHVAFPLSFVSHKMLLHSVFEIYIHRENFEGIDISWFNFWGWLWFHLYKVLFFYFNIQYSSEYFQGDMLART